MKKFNYKAKTSQGKSVKGVVEAVNQKAAVRILQEKKLIPYSLKEKGKGGFGLFLASFMGISSKDVTEFTRQLSTMINSGLALTNSLTILQEQAKPAFAKILADVVKQIEGGSTFNEALAMHDNVFSKTYIALIKSGEASGALDRVLVKMADTLEKQQEFKGRVKGALIYPIIVVTGMMVVMFIMMVFVVPKLTSMYQDFGTKLPTSTKILIGTSKFFQHFWFLLIGGLVGLAYGFKLWRATPLGRQKIDQVILRLPIIGNLEAKIVLTNIARTLSMLLGAGVTIIDALNITAEATNNAVFEQSIKAATRDVEKGLPLTATFNRHEEYPPLFSQMVSVGEETGKLDEVLDKVAKQFEMESDLAVKGLTTAIEPLMMIVLGIGVAFIVMSIITPIYNLTSQF